MMANVHVHTDLLSHGFKKSLWITEMRETMAPSTIFMMYRSGLRRVQNCCNVSNTSKSIFLTIHILIIKNS